jgi:membrane protease YdiL (CAAX protease family)
MSANDPVNESVEENGAPALSEEVVSGPALHGLTVELPPQPPSPPPPAVRRPRPPHPGFWWSLLWCVGFLLFTQVPGAVLGGGLLVALMFLSPQQLEAVKGAKGGLPDTPAVSAIMAVTFAFTELLVVGFSWLVLRLVIGRDWTRQVALRRPGLAHLLLVLAGFPALALLGNGAYEVIRHVLHVPSLADLLKLPDMEQMIKVFAQWPWPVAVLVIGAGPGVGEELWCRGFLGRGLVGRYGWLLGVAFTSFFFGLIHLDPAQGLYAMLVGFGLHFVYLTTRSLWLPILLHFLNNSLSVIVTRLPQLQEFDSAPGTAFPAAVFVSAGVLLVAVGWALYRSRARLVAPDGEVAWRPLYPGVEYPPPHSDTRVAHPRPSWVAWLAVLGALAAFVLSCCLTFVR